MAPRELDELGQIVDDAKDTVEELQYDHSQADEKLDQLHEALEDAADDVDALEEDNKLEPRRVRGDSDNRQRSS